MAEWTLVKMVAVSAGERNRNEGRRGRGQIWEEAREQQTERAMSSRANGGNSVEGDGE